MNNVSLLERIAVIIQKSDKQTAKQAKIIEVAISLFAEKGYANTATAEIAKVAGVAEGTIFKHYGTKENLLLSIMVPFLKDFLPSMLDELFEELLAEETSFEDFLRALLKNRIRFLLDNKEVFQVVMKEIVYKEELKSELLPYFLEHTSLRLTKVVETFQKRGEIADRPVAQTINLLATTIYGFFISRFVLLNRDSISDEEINEMVLFVLNGIGK